MNRRLLRILPAALVACALSVGTAGAVTINITYGDSPGEGFLDPSLGAQRRNVLEAAASNWAARLEGTVPITIYATMDPMDGGADWAILGGAYSNWFSRNFSGAPLTNIWYSGALANQLAGSDQNPGEPDIVIIYNSEVDKPEVLGPSSFYYGTDGAVTTSGGWYNIDFYQTCLHEIGHGLGLTSLLKEDGSWNGSYPSSYDYYLAEGNTENAVRLRTLSQAARALRIKQDNLFFAGPNARIAAGGVSPKLYAPTTYEPGSSVAHLDENTYSAPWPVGPMPRAGHNELMTPSLGPGVTHHTGPIFAGILMDIGWQFKPFNVAETASGLRGLAGLRSTTNAEVMRLKRYNQVTYPATLTLADVIASARAAAGVDANPHFLGTP